MSRRSDDRNTFSGLTTWMIPIVVCPAPGEKVAGAMQPSGWRPVVSPSRKRNVFELPLYPVVQRKDINQTWLDWYFADQPSLEISCQLLSLPRISAREISSRVNFERYFEQRRVGHARQLQADFQRLIAQGDSTVLEQDCAALAHFCRQQAPALAKWLHAQRNPILAALHRPELQARFILLLSELEDGDTRVALTREGFSRLQNAMVSSRQLAKMTPPRSLKEDQIVWGRSPVRLDLAGGWTDTPPFCLQAGGSVLNVAVLLNGQPPSKSSSAPPPNRASSCARSISAPPKR
ncbi:MAG: hypothetical protein QM760_20450 [Nibricoccus sp.]